jgi:hypothetical protein
VNFSAQDAYRALVKDHLTPALKARGFKGTAGRYELPAVSHWSLAELQKSQFSDTNHVSFTANLLVVRRDHWQQTTKRVSIFSLVPTPGHVRDVTEQARLGMLASPDGIDDWYGLSEHTNVDTLAKAFLADLDGFGIPWMKAKQAQR